MKLIFLLLFLTSTARGDDFERTFKVVLSFLKFDDRPSSVTALNLCWKETKLLTLAKNLGRININLGRSVQEYKGDAFLQHTVFLVDLSCNGTEHYLLQANKKELFKSPYRWLMLALDDNALEILDKLHILVDSDVIIAKNTNQDEVSFIEAYKIAENSKTIIFTSRATWTSLRDEKERITTKIAMPRTKTVIANEHGLIEDHRTTKVLSIRRKNLMKHPLTIASVLNESDDTKNHLDDRKMLHHDSITKMTYMVVRICFEMLNSTERRLFANTWGYQDKNGSWNGIIDLLLEKKADLGTLTIFTQERMKIIDYIAMVGTTAVRFVFREPPLSYVSNIFTLPFTAAVWWAVLICVLACAMFLYLTSKWEASMSLHPLQLDGSWADVIILIIGAVLQQGCTLEPRYAAGRCVTLLLFLSLTILYAAYSANIVVLLRAPSSTVRTVADLLHSPIKLGASDFEYNRYFFKKLNEPVRKAIYDKKIAPKGKKPNFYSMAEGVEKIRQGLFAFHMELNPGYRLIQETYQEGEKCDLVEIDYINEIDPWVPGQKRSPFKDLFKINFLKIRESGIQSCVRRRLIVPRPKCLGAVSTFSSVGMVDMLPVLLTTTYGMLLAPAVLFLEIMYKRLTTLRKKRKAARENFVILE